RPFADIGKRAITVIVVKNTLAEVGDKQVFETVVVIIADADALSPAGVRHAGFRGDVGESAVAIVLEEMGSRLLSSGEALQAPAVDQKNIQPAIIVIIVKRHAATRGLQK